MPCPTPSATDAHWFWRCVLPLLLVCLGYHNAVDGATTATATGPTLSASETNASATVNVTLTESPVVTPSNPSTTASDTVVLTLTENISSISQTATESDEPSSASESHTITLTTSDDASRTSTDTVRTFSRSANSLSSASTATNTLLFTGTLSATKSEVVTTTETATSTETVSWSASRGTSSRSPSSSPTPSASSTRTASRSTSPSHSASLTPPHTETFQRTLTRISPTRQTHTRTSSASASRSPTNTTSGPTHPRTPSPTVSASLSPTSTASGSGTGSPTATSTRSASATASVSRSTSGSTSRSASSSNSSSASTSLSATMRTGGFNSTSMTTNPTASVVPPYMVPPAVYATALVVEQMVFLARIQSFYSDPTVFFENNNGFAADFFRAIKLAAVQRGMDPATALYFLTDSAAAQGNVLQLVACVVDASVYTGDGSTGTSTFYNVSVCKNDDVGPACTTQGGSSSAAACKVDDVSFCQCATGWASYPPAALIRNLSSVPGYPEPSTAAPVPTGEATPVPTATPIETVPPPPTTANPSHSEPTATATSSDPPPPPPPTSGAMGTPMPTTTLQPSSGTAAPTSGSTTSGTPIPTTPSQPSSGTAAPTSGSTTSGAPIPIPTTTSQPNSGTATPTSGSTTSETPIPTPTSQPSSGTAAPTSGSTTSETPMPTTTLQPSSGTKAEPIVADADGTTATRHAEYRRANRKLLSISLVQLQFVFRLEYVPAFRPASIDDVAEAYQLLRLLTADVLTQQPLSSFARQYLLDPRRANITNSSLFPPPPIVPVPIIQSSTAFLPVAAALVFPAVVLVLIGYRGYKYLRWRRTVGKFDVVPRRTAEDGHDDGGDAAGDDAEMVRRLGNGAWVRQQRQQQPTFREGSLPPSSPSVARRMYADSNTSGGALLDGPSRFDPLEDLHLAAENKKKKRSADDDDDDDDGADDDDDNDGSRAPVTVPRHRLMLLGPSGGASPGGTANGRAAGRLSRDAYVRASLACARALQHSTEGDGLPTTTTSRSAPGGGPVTTTTTRSRGNPASDPMAVLLGAPVADKRPPLPPALPHEQPNTSDAAAARRHEHDSVMATSTSEEEKDADVFSDPSGSREEEDGDDGEEEEELEEEEYEEDEEGLR